VAKILIINSDKKAAEFIARNLSAAGHRCRVENSAEKAIEVAQANRPDLFVVDVMLAGASGFGVCRRVRWHPDLYTIPVVVLSSMVDEEEVQHGFSQGADEYIKKPFGMDHLSQRVDALLKANEDCLDPDPITRLPNAKLVRRELQHHISRQTPFTLAYVEFMHIREFGKRFGPEIRDKAVKWLADGLRDCSGDSPTMLISLGHMGGGHFVAILSSEDASFYCTRVRQFFQANFENLYETLGVARAYRHAAGDGSPENAPPNLDILLCVTARDGKEATTPRAMFEILSQIRQKALMRDRGGVHVDRRRTATTTEP
jgi:DNA-binding response OmpR family regulator